MGLEASIGLAALSAVGGFLEAQQANQARRRQNAAVENASKAEQANAKIAANERREQVAREQQQYLGTVRSSSAARGASSTALTTGAAAQGSEAVSDINTQLMMDLLGISSRGEAQKDRRRTNAFLAGFNSGLSGFSTGLGLTSSLNNLGNSTPPTGGEGMNV
jgi:hypothetical protein